jgi:hypothetical protein
MADTQITLNEEQLKIVLGALFVIEDILKENYVKTGHEESFVYNQKVTKTATFIKGQAGLL